MGVYRSLLRPVLFRTDAEWMHGAAIRCAELAAGNPRPRLFRLPGQRAIVVHYGLPNDGASCVAARLSARPRPGVPLGINVVSTNRGAGAAPESDDAVIADYTRSVALLQPHADYLCLNLSCPNTRDGRNFFHEPRRLALLLEALAAQGVHKPLFLKVAPSAQVAELERFLEALSPARFVTGFSINLPAGKPDGLARLLERDGFAQVSDAVGVEAE